VWQELRSELHGKGLEVVTVALDSAGPEVARPYVEAAGAQHPSLIDEAHLLDELFGIVNVPSGVWIDEVGMIVRPPEPAFAAYPEVFVEPVPEDAPEYKKRILRLEKQLRVEHEKYVAALRDWAERGAESAYVLTPDQVVARSQPRGQEAARASAHFELAQHFQRLGLRDDAVEHFKEAHRLQPENWTYKCQAWSLVVPDLGPSDVYESDWASEVERMGPDLYYPPIEM
jgi:tetratricopeptide (TPR) repeat protein